MSLRFLLLSGLFVAAFAKESGEKHLRIFTQAFGSMVVSEIGDKTFFLAAIMSMKYNRIAVWSGAGFALVLMTVISCAFGMVVPQLIPKFYTEIVVTIIFYLFGAKLLYSWYTMEQEGDELQEVEQELQHLDSKLLSAPNVESNQVADTPSSPQNFVSVQFHSVLWQAFIMTFLAEWGDRSQITTISLAAVQDADIVCYGASVGHLLCTSIAVLGGKLLANKISEKTVNLAGGLVFLLFGILHTIDLLSQE